MSVRTERDGHVLVVRIEREEKRNAIDDATAAALGDAFDQLDDDPDLWAGVLTGTLTVFSAGTDLRNGGSPRTARGGEYGLVRRRRRTPLVAAVEGPALGGGFELALACDVVVAAEGARFGLPEVRRGVVPSSGALLRLPRAVPHHVARDLLLTGTPVTAARAHQLGLVSRLAPDGEALAVAREVAAEICAGSPSAVALTAGALDEIARLAVDDETAWAVSDRAVAAVKQTDDMAEGVSAFLERRPPRWTGR